MPTYQYECDDCEYAFEVLQSMSDKKLKKCPKCKKMKLYRLIGGGSGIIFKGTGFYETDFKTKTSAKGAETQEKISVQDETPKKTSKKVVAAADNK